MYKVLARNFLWRHLYTRQSEVGRMLIASCAFSHALLGFRMVYTNQVMFAFLSWNLLLAIVPYLITQWLIRKVDWIENKVKFLVAGMVWLFFLPNAFYIITDLFHLTQRDGIPLWYDLALILSFAWNGIIAGILSMRQMEKILFAKWQLRQEWLFIMPLMFLNAFGIYIGRYLRFNSWDVITQPLQLAQDIFSLLLHPVQNRFDWSMIICYTMLLLFIYRHSSEFHGSHFNKKGCRK